MQLSPIVASTVLALIIDGCSNVIAKRLKSWNDNVDFVFNGVLFIQFSIMTAIAAPINFHWQAWLEKTFPQYRTVMRKKDDKSVDAEEKGIEMRDTGEGVRAVELEEKVRDWHNVWKRWFTDCITLGAIFNTLMFLILMGMLKGKGLTQIMTDIRTVRAYTGDLMAEVKLTAL